MKNNRRKRSIGRKIFLQSLVGVTIFIIIALFANVVLLKPYYLSQIESDLLAAIDEFDSIDTQNIEAVETIDALNAIENNYDINIIMFDGERNITYSSTAKISNGNIIGMESRGYGKNTDRMPITDILRVRGIVEPQGDIRYLDDNIKIYISDIDDINMQSSNMILFYTADDGSIVVFQYQLQKFSDAISLFNVFLLTAAIISIIISVILSLVMSRRFTTPILQMNKSAKAMADQDFSNTCDVSTGDELEELSDSINIMNESLKESIGDLKQANEQLSIELEKQKRLDTLRKRFVSTVSHELKTPISLIQGYSYGLKSNIVDDEKKKGFYSDVIIEESQRMSDLVDDLLDLSHMESGYLKLTMNQFDVSVWMNDMVKKYEYYATSSQKSLRISGLESVQVLGDVKRLEQVFVNYITNAIRHSTCDDIYIDCIVQPDSVKISVKNKGDILSEEQQESIWNDFYRVDDDRSRNTGGHGLGLAIVKNIMEGHKQEFGCKAIDDGMEFYFTIETSK